MYFLRLHDMHHYEVPEGKNEPKLSHGYIKNPDLSLVEGVDKKYWKYENGVILPMSIDEMLTVDLTHNTLAVTIALSQVVRDYEAGQVSDIEYLGDMFQVSPDMFQKLTALKLHTPADTMWRSSDNYQHEATSTFVDGLIISIIDRTQLLFSDMINKKGSLSNIDATASISTVQTAIADILSS